MQHISKVKHILRVGQKVKTNGTGAKRIGPSDFVYPENLTGVVGEIDKRSIYIFHNEELFVHGSRGNILPQSKGFKYSWVILSSGNFEIEILSGEFDWNSIYNGG